MKPRPIIFSGPMVCALLEGRKTQTRRLTTSPLAKCERGDLLWVREAVWQSRFQANASRDAEDEGWSWDKEVLYRATDSDPLGFYWKARPSIHMPRWASRLTSGS